MKSNVIPKIGFLCFIILVYGCSPKGTGVFVNATDKVAFVRIFSSHDESQQIAFSVSPGEVHKVQGTRAVNAIEVDLGSDLKPFSRVLHIPDRDNEYARSGEMKMFFLISDGEIYRIPSKFRKTWEDNLTHIAQKKHALPPLQD